MLVCLCMSWPEVIASTSTERPNSTRVVGQTKRFLDETAGRKPLESWKVPCLAEESSNPQKSLPKRRRIGISDLLAKV